MGKNLNQVEKLTNATMIQKYGKCSQLPKTHTISIEDCMIKKTFLILFILITFSFCIEEKVCFGQRMSCDYRSNLLNQKLIICPLPQWSLQNPYNTYDSDYGESVVCKIPLWKQAGIYSLEFIGASVGILASLFAGYIFSGMGGGDPYTWNIPSGFGVYTIGNLLITNTLTYSVGKLFNKNHHW